nr:monofunctional biosynthetic peptidoglycan transglycosylase [Hartmannibacter diazotrophicus]
MTRTRADRPDISSRPSSIRSWFRRQLRRVVLVFGALVGLILILVPVYAVVPPPVSTLMLRDLVTLHLYQRDWVSLDEISPFLVRSVIMSEDGQFCSHVGVDWGALSTVIEGADDDGPSRGASTIPMQTVKNLFLWSSRSYIRKGLEIPLALYADAIWSKRRIMELYLNIAEWGPGIYGAEAAARHYFGKSAADLTRRQAALLASALPNPYVRNPAKPSRRQLAIARTIETRERKSGAYVSCVFPN